MTSGRAFAEGQNGSVIGWTVRADAVSERAVIEGRSVPGLAGNPGRERRHG